MSPPPSPLIQAGNKMTRSHPSGVLLCYATMHCKVSAYVDRKFINVMLFYSAINSSKDNNTLKLVAS